MRKKSLLCAFLGILVFTACANTRSKYENDALNKVRFAPVQKHADLALVENGKLNFAIVCDLAAEKAVRTPTGKPISWKAMSLHRSVGTLCDAFEMCTGIRPEVLQPGATELNKYRYKIVLGKNTVTDSLGIDTAKIPLDGFVVRSYQDGIVIAGRDGSMAAGFYDDLDVMSPNYASNGTWNGVWDFAERFLGIRYYYPGLGIHAPKVRNLVVSPVAYEDSPFFLQRILEPSFPNGKWPWPDLKNTTGKFIGAYRDGNASRFVGNEFPGPWDLSRLYPDKIDTIFYRDRGGNLYYSPTDYGKNVFDVTNPALADILIDAYKKFYDSKGLWNGKPLCWPLNSEYVYFGQCDRGYRFDNAFALAHPRKNPTGASINSEIYGAFYKTFAEKVNKAFPGKKLSVLAYSDYLLAPESIAKMPDNLRVFVCTGSPVYIRNPELREFWKKTYSDWNRILASKIAPYTYDVFYGKNGCPVDVLRGYFEGEFLRAMRPYIGREYRACAQASYRTYYSTYLVARAMWNPDFNAQAALDEHWPLLYGEKAGASLKKFYHILLDRWVNHYLPTFRPKTFGCIAGVDHILLYQKGFPVPVIDDLERALAEAESATVPGSVERRRVDFFAGRWKQMLADIRAFHSIRIPEYTIFRNSGKLILDGKGDETAWEKAERIRFRDAYAGNDKEVVQPEARILYDGKGIWLLFRAPAPYRIGKQGPWSGDCFEFFLSPGESKSKIYQFVVGSDRTCEVYFKSQDPPRPVEIRRQAGDVKSAVITGKDEWSAELYIPYSILELEKVPEPGDLWYVNLISNRKIPAEYTSFSPTLYNNYMIHFYGKLKFRGEP
ncbi:MAG: hypothetical protein BWY31_03673 [Lentisphaerae bacterium ADurb.Bin242]|nr:MAG: hypothetical protein BWY31_03673 [Lentisphaerae bacterium ADurb.Bin242]